MSVLTEVICGWRSSRAGVLLEVMLALALCAAAGGAILVMTDRAAEGLQRGREAAAAADLAQTVMARIEAGLDTPLAGHQPDDFQPPTPRVAREVRVRTDRSPFDGLTCVEVEVVVNPATPRQYRYVLRQLVRLEPAGDDTPGPDDPLTERLAAAREEERP